MRDFANAMVHLQVSILLAISSGLLKVNEGIVWMVTGLNLKARNMIKEMEGEGYDIEVSVPEEGK